MLKLVIIVGKDSNLPGNIRAMAASNGDIAIIGNGKALLKDEEMAILRGRVDSTTKFHVLANGFVATHTPAVLRHMIDLFADDKLPVPTTIDVLQRIGQLTGGKPVQVDLWSGYSSAEPGLVKRLPLGSVLVTHDPHNSNIVNHLATQQNVKFSKYFPQHRLLDPSPAVEKLISKSMAAAFDDLSRLNIPQSPSGTLDYNSVLSTLHLGSSAGLQVAINLPKSHDRSYIALEFGCPEQSKVKEFCTNIAKQVYKAIGDKRASGISIPTKHPEILLSQEAINEVEAIITTNPINIPEIISENRVAPIRYSKVLLLGPKIALNPSIKALYNDGKSIIIGDGEKLIAIGQLEKLRGLVDSDTRFDIVGHGNVYSGTGEHRISLLDSALDFTRLVAVELRKILDKPIHEVHVWSCYAGAAPSILQVLGVGSTVIAHGPKDAITLGREGCYSLEASLKAHKKSIHFANSSYLGSVHGLVVGKKTHAGTDGIEYFEFKPPALTSNARIIADYFKSITTALTTAFAVAPSVLVTRDDLFMFAVYSFEYSIHFGVPFSAIAEAIRHAPGLQRHVFEYLIIQDAFEAHMLIEYLTELQIRGITLLDFDNISVWLTNSLKQSPLGFNKIVAAAKALKIDEAKIQAFIEHLTHKRDEHKEIADSDKSSCSAAKKPKSEETVDKQDEIPSPDISAQAVIAAMMQVFANSCGSSAEALDSIPYPDLPEDNITHADTIIGATTT